MKNLSLAALSAASVLTAGMAFAQANEVPITIDGVPTMINYAKAVDACALPEETIRAQVTAMQGGGYVQDSSVNLSDSSTADTSTLNNPTDAEQDMNADVAATTDTSAGTTAGSDLSATSTADQATLNNPTDAEQDMNADVAATTDTSGSTATAAAPAMTAICDITANRANELGITAASN